MVHLAGWEAVGIPSAPLRYVQKFAPYTITIMTWGGLRGGISVALALSLPATAWRDTVLAATYGVVIFSILVQALTLRPLVQRLEKRS